METRRDNWVSDPQQLTVAYGSPEVDRDHQLAAQLAAARGTIAHLETALISARTIGAAIGIVMAQRKVTYEDAFEVLAATSQRTNRKLRAVAEDVLMTGEVRLTDSPRSR